MLSKQNKGVPNKVITLSDIITSRVSVVNLLSRLKPAIFA